jgi:hypothetical protein
LLRKETGLPKIKNSRHFKKTADFDITKVSVYYCPVNKDYCFVELDRLVVVKPFKPGRFYYKAWKEVAEVMEVNQVCVGKRGYLISVEERLTAIEKNKNRKKKVKEVIEEEEVKEINKETKPKHKLMSWDW